MAFVFFAPASKNVLFIGNSHTWDSEPKNLTVIDSKLHVKYFIKCGQSIEAILAEPTKPCVKDGQSSDNLFETIKNEEFDLVVIQPFVSKNPSSTVKSEIDAVARLIDKVKSSKSKHAEVFLYLTWPNNNKETLGEFNYGDAWARSYVLTDRLLHNSQSFSDLLIKELSLRNVKVDGVVPMGQVLSQVAEKIQDKTLGVKTFYRDAWHLNNFGRALATAVMYSSITSKRIDSSRMPLDRYKQNMESWAAVDEDLAGKVVELDSAIEIANGVVNSYKNSID